MPPLPPQGENTSCFFLQRVSTRPGNKWDTFLGDARMVVKVHMKELCGATGGFVEPVHFVKVSPLRRQQGGKNIPFIETLLVHQFLSLQVLDSRVLQALDTQ